MFSVTPLRRGPVLWPPRSPDLTLLDFFPKGQSRGIVVSWRDKCTNGRSCSSVYCLYFGGHHSAEDCLDMHSGIRL
ncbi:hypothetical protein TNCV_1496271 [Trichonephila clavipes]|nr:hypothetical protein TNCV_1496271 [Trichonephila clavipes]